MRLSYAKRYTLIATLLAILFVILHLMLNVTEKGVPLTAAAIARALGPDDVFIMTTPITLGFLAYLVGRQRDRLITHARYLDALNRIIHSLTRSLDLDRTLAETLERSVEVLRLDDSLLYLFDQDRLTLRASTPGVPEVVSNMIEKIQIEQWLPALLPKIENQQLVTLDLETDLPQLAEFREAGYHWLASVLIQSDSQPAGLVIVASRQRQHLSPDQSTFLMTVANQIASALDSARSLAEVRRRARDLEAIAQVNRTLLAGIGLDALLNSIVTSAQVRFGLPYVAVMWVDEAAGEIFIRAHAGPLAATTPLGHRQKLSEGLAARVYRTGRFYLARDVRSEPEYVPTTNAPVLSSLLIPMIISQKVIGIVVSDSLALDAFTTEDVAALTTLTDQVTIAAENTRLYTVAERERRRIAAILQSTADAVILIDPEDRVQLVNPAAERIFGVQASAVIAQPVERVLTLPRVLDAYHQIVRRSSADAMRTFEVALSDGTTYLVNLTAVKDEAAILFGQVVVMQDITDLKRLDQLKTQMVQMASHDLRNPLGVAMGYIDLLQEDLKPLSLAREQMLNGLRHALDRMYRLVTDLLSIERIEARTDQVREAINLNRLIQEVVAEFREQAQARHQSLELSIAARLPTVEGDPVRLKQALSNLVGNAIKYTPDRGQIWVRLRVDGYHVLTEVQDTGYGIPRSAQSNLFKRFYRVKSRDTEDIEGTGLGLSLVKAVVEQHGGRMTVESDEGHGSTFRMELPIAERSVSEASAQESEIDHAS